IVAIFGHNLTLTIRRYVRDVRSVATPVMVSTSPATQTSTSTESQSQSVSTIGGSSSAGSSYTLTSTDSPNFTSSFSTSPAGIIIPDPPMKSTPKSTITTQQVSKGPTTTEVSSCSTNSVVKHCLIIIATLAAIATIFIICTIVLCTKLSARRYSIRRNPQGTEMMCISNLLPDRNPTYSRQRNPVRNGILVIPGCGDSDEDGGDNLTLSSFLPDNDRYV
uniref:P-selectin glycoprotein ligand 1 n=1 Tax=Gouania willdenowi TaxID=441366 RepID=A0A8C5HH11_GOUWI